MRILLVCQDVGWNIGWSFRRLLPELGHVCWTINEEDYFGQLRSSTIWRIFNWLFNHPPAYRKFNQDLISAAISFQPDLLLVLKGNYIAPETLIQIREQTDAKLVNYCKDTFFSNNPKLIAGDLQNSIELYDLIATMRRIVPKLYAVGAQRAAFVRDGYDPSVHYPVVRTPQDIARWGSDVVFIGTYEAERAMMLQELAKRFPGQLNVYGGQWEKVLRKSPLAQCIKGRELYGAEKLLAIACSKICLNFLRKANQDTYTARTFEIPACGAFMLAERSEDHQELLGEDQGVVCFDPDPPAELVEKVGYYLAHDQERRRIATEGHRRVVTGGHTYWDRLNEILDLVGEL